jgi:DNA-binding SARP family transcriptional activator
MRYEILGPLRVTNGTVQVRVEAPKLQILLATLLIRAGQVVTLDQLVTEIWNQAPPRRAVSALYVYVSELRKLLKQRDQDRPIVTGPAGYMFRDDGGEIDLCIFQQFITRGRAALNERQYELGVDCFEKALAVWRGSALSGLRGGPIISGFTTRMEELRMECVQSVIDAKLEVGRHREMVGDLYELITIYPHHEVFYRQLMLALYHSERRADALHVYQAARIALQENLGLEPGQPLRDLQLQILTADSGISLR